MMNCDECNTEQRKSSYPRVDERRGVVLVLIAICLPLLLIGAAFAVDMTYLRVARNELRLAADAAARSAGSVYSKTRDARKSVAAAKTAGELNFVGGKPLLLEDADIEFGASEYDESKQTWNFTPNGEPRNSVRVTARKSADAPSGKIHLFFSQALFELNIALTSEAISVTVEPEVMYAVDRSGTMAYPGDAVSNELIPPPQRPGWAWCQPAPGFSRWVLAAMGVNRSLDRLGRNQRTWVGLATFADDATTDAPLGKQYQAVRDALANRTSSYCGGPKKIDQGVRQALQELSFNSPSSGLAEQHVVLITDGKLAAHELTDAAGAAVAAGVILDIVSYGFEADVSGLDAAAHITGGRHVHALTAAAIDMALIDIERDFTAKSIIIAP